ncbi:MAG: putative sulfate/molybdate transporter [Thermodesulfobacteriota bacterium]
MEESHGAGGAFRFDRVELAGAFGDLGTLLPIVVAMILINGLSPSAVFLSFGLFYLLSGWYYRLPVPVQPLKAVGALAIAYPAQVTESVIGAAGIIFGAILLFLTCTGTVDRLARLFTPPVIRGIQLALGLVFLRKGVELIVRKNLFLSGEAGVLAEYHGNLMLGVVVFLLVLALLDNKKAPAGLAALAAGILAGISLGGYGHLQPSFGATPIRLHLPAAGDFWTALTLLILPQIPLTMGNACVGTADMCRTLFPENPRQERSGASSFAFTMGLANLPAGLLGAIPMCHGTGGLAAHYRFGARTGGAPIMIGALFVVMAMAFGELWFTLLAMIPNAVLGVLLIFAGLELCPLVRSLKTNEEYFVALLISGIAMAVPNMAWAFGTGILVDMFLRRFKIRI